MYIIVCMYVYVYIGLKCFQQAGFFVIGTLSNLATNLEDLGEQLGRSPTSKSWPPWAVYSMKVCAPRPITASTAPFAKEVESDVLGNLGKPVF